MGYLQSLLGKQERIVHSTRTHWLFIMPALLFYVFMAAVIVAATLIIRSRLENDLALVILVLLLYPGVRFLLRFLNWFNDRYLVTTYRVIEVKGIINKRVSDSAIDKVNDVVLTQSMLGRIMNFGDVEILTASEAGVNLLRHISNPLLFKREMLNQREETVDHHWTADRDVAATPEDRLIDSLQDLRSHGLLSDEDFQAKLAQVGKTPPAGPDKGAPKKAGKP
jgi:uncharacterized membrane protein YdbT with pleckstrin-like domain